MSNSTAIRIIHLHNFPHAKALRSRARVAAGYRFFALPVGMGIPALPAGRWCAARSPPSARSSRLPRRPRRMIIGPTASRFPTGSRPRAAGRPMHITCGPTKCTASPTTLTRSTTTTVTAGKSRLPGTAQPGRRLLDILPRRCCQCQRQQRPVRSLLFLRPDGLLMRGPATRQIERVHRMYDAGNL